MDQQTYHRMTLEQLKGQRVKTLRTMTTGVAVVPVGTVCTITGKFNGFELESVPCQTCGVKVRITRVSPRDVDLLEVSP